MDAIEDEVRAAMAADPNYPLGEADAMKWAIAFRLTAQMANPLGKALRAFPHSDGQEPLDGIMVGWFANAMAIGSGAPYALGAMEAGASAPGAVGIAGRFDNFTGGGVDILRQSDYAPSHEHLSDTR